MEGDDFIQCGGDAYARGHLKNIAKATDSSASEFIELFNANHSTDSRSIHSQLVDNNAAAMKRENKRLCWKVLLSASLSIIVLIGVVQFALSEVEGEDVVAPIVSDSPTPSAEPLVTPSAAVTPETDVTATTAGVTLVISATRGDSSIHVVASGETLYKGRLLKGEEQIFTDPASIAIYLSNAGDVDLTLNGEKLPPRGGQNQEIRETFRAK
jgi:cytoskeletal protein RodZ